MDNQDLPARYLSQPAEVHQAAGILIAHFAITSHKALLVIDNFSAAQHQSMQVTAGQIVAGSVNLDGLVALPPVESSDGHEAI